MMKLKILLLATCLVLVSCNGQPVPENEPPILAGEVRSVDKHNTRESKWIDVVVQLEDGTRVGFECRATVFLVGNDYDDCLPLEVGQKVQVTHNGADGDLRTWEVVVE